MPDVQLIDTPEIRGLAQLIVDGAGDGVTDDTVPINNVNLAGRTVNLMNKSWVYTGELSLTLARFTNGRILSTVQGTLDFRQGIIVGNFQITVGTGSTIKKLRYLMPFLRQLRVIGDLEIRLTEKNTPDDATGTMALDTADFYHPDMQRIRFTAAAFAAGQGVPNPNLLPSWGNTYATNALARAADKVFLLSRFNANIYFVGDDGISGGIGFSPSRGLKAERLLIESHTRYGASMNWGGSHSSKELGGNVSLTDCGFDGGLWGLTVIGAAVTFGGAAVAFYHQINGGGIYAEDCTFYKPASCKFYGYTPKVTANALQPKYVISATRCRFLWEVEGSRLNTSFFYGPTVHAMFLEDCSGYLWDPYIDGASGAITAYGDGWIEWGKIDGRNADPTTTALTAGTGQPGTPANLGSGAYIYFGRRAHGVVEGVTFGNVIAANYLRCDGGSIQFGAVATFAADNCKATTKAFSFFASRGNTLAPNLTNSKAGSNNGIAAAWGSDVYLASNVGAAPDITVNTLTNGNLIAQ